MNLRFLTAVTAAAMLSSPTLVSAQSSAMHGDSAMHATMVCRAAAPGEKPSAMMTVGNTALVCKSLAKEMSASKMGPDLSNALTPAQADAAWQKWVNSIIVIPPTGGG